GARARAACARATATCARSTSASWTASRFSIAWNSIRPCATAISLRSAAFCPWTWIFWAFPSSPGALKIPTRKRRAMRRWRSCCPFTNATAPACAARSRASRAKSARSIRRNAAARRYFCLATRYTRRQRAPMLIAVGGLIGTGKSTLAGLIGMLTGFPVLSSDVERKKLAGAAPTERKAEEFQQGIYREEFTDKTYARLLEAADRCLGLGRGAVIDATFAAARRRRPFVELAHRHGAAALFIECT